MQDDHSRAEPESEIIRDVLHTIDQGQEPSFEDLARRFPEREAEIHDTLRVLDSYQKQVSDIVHARRAVPSEGLLAPGMKLGDFTIQGVLGQGAMGIVYRARQTSAADKEVALKVLLPALVARDRRFVDRFRREAEYASRIRHPNMASVYGAGSEGDALFLVMQLVEGRNLQEILTDLALQRLLGQGQHIRLRYIRSVVAMVKDLACALGAVHSRNLIHRDVKPANILLEDPDEAGKEPLAGRPVLVDFGLLRTIAQSEITGSRTILGTPAFASPEVQLGREVDVRADVFSLGVILHDLLTLTPPGERRPASAGLPDIRALNPAVDARLAAIVGRATEDRRELRYADGTEFSEDLDRYLGDKSVRALPSTAVGRARLWIRRNPARALRAGLTGAVFLLVFLVACSWFVIRATQLYSAASAGKNLEQKGHLAEAAKRYRLLLENQEFVRILPGLKGDLDIARDYWFPDQGRLAKICDLLTLETRASFSRAHNLIQRLLLTPGNEDLRERLFCFLIREFRNREDSWRKSLSLDSFVNYFLIRPCRNHENSSSSRISENYMRLLETDLFSIVHDREVDLEVLYPAISILSGFPGQRAFRAFLPLLDHPDVEVRRLALCATYRILWETREENMLTTIPQALISDWYRRTVERIHEQSLSPGERLDPFTYAALYFSSHHAAWIRMKLRDEGRLRSWGFPENLQRYLQELEASFRSCKLGKNPEPVRSNISWIDSFPVKLVPRIMYNHFNRLKNSDYFYTNIWDNRSRTNDHGRITGPANREAWSAKFDFTGEEPCTEGGAIQASWLSATVEKESLTNPDARHCLVLSLPGQSELHLRSILPDRSVKAMVTISHLQASRDLLPRFGHARIRVSIQNGDLELSRRMSPKRTNWIIPIDQEILEESDELDVRIQLDSANTTYWVSFVEINFQKI